MSFPQRLPIVNNDDGTWGDIIRQYLKKEHYDDGTDNAVNGGHQNVTIRPGTTTAAPLTFNQSGASLLTTPADGSVEYASSAFYMTVGSTRKRIAIYDDSAGAAGDLYYRDGSGNFVPLPKGTAGQVLKTGTTPSWGANNTGFKVYNPGGSYAMTTNDTVVFADASGGSNITINLPAVSSSINGYRFYIKRVDGSSNTVTIARAVGGSETIDGQTSITLNMQYMAITVVCDGSNWYIL
jgi:hypothetical protein